MSDDLHSPTTAAPTPAAAGGGTATTPPTTAERLRDAAPEPVTHAAQQAAAAIATARQSVANAWSGEEQTASERPELLAGAAFAGGLLAAMILKRLSR